VIQGTFSLVLLLRVSVSLLVDALFVFAREALQLAVDYRSAEKSFVLEHDRPANEAVSVWPDFHAGESVSNQAKPAKNQPLSCWILLVSASFSRSFAIEAVVDGVQCG